MLGPALVLEAWYALAPQVVRGFVFVLLVLACLLAATMLVGISAWKAICRLFR